MVTEQLKAAQREQGHQAPHVQGVSGGVKAAIQGYGRGEFFFQFRRVRAIGYETAPFQFIKNGHATSLI